MPSTETEAPIEVQSDITGYHKICVDSNNKPFPQYIIMTIFFLPLTFKEIVIRYSNWNQNMYDKILLFLFRSMTLQFIIVQLHNILFHFGILA